MISTVKRVDRSNAIRMIKAFSLLISKNGNLYFSNIFKCFMASVIQNGDKSNKITMKNNIDSIVLI